jgi:hypothetical protein
MKPAIELILEWSNTETERYGIHTVRYNKSTPTAARRAAQKVIAEWGACPSIIVDAARLERVADEVVLARWDNGSWDYVDKTTETN